MHTTLAPAYLSLKTTELSVVYSVEAFNVVIPVVVLTTVVWNPGLKVLGNVIVIAETSANITPKLSEAFTEYAAVFDIIGAHIILTKDASFVNAAVPIEVLVAKAKSAVVKVEIDASKTVLTV